MDENRVVLAGDLPAMTISRLVARGELTRLARGVYTASNDPENFVRQHFLEIAGRVFPQSVITDKSARTGRPVLSCLYLAGPGSAKRLALPGLQIESRIGPGAVAGDIELPCGLFLASRPRGLLDNMRATRATKTHPRATLSPTELDDWLDDLCATDGEPRLNEYRDAARAIAGALGVSDTTVHRLSERMSAAIGSHYVTTKSVRFGARQAGVPYDAVRLARFELLGAALSSSPPQHHFLDSNDTSRYQLAPFFDAYFSNFVEGTEFAIDEAKAIVFDHFIPPRRVADAHDIVGTFEVLDRMRNQLLPQTAKEFIDLLQTRHAVIMGGRPEKRPGEFKTIRNQAGGTIFVDPSLVTGTLMRGYDVVTKLTTPFERAVLTMFVVAEVHPFDDGNGRIARAMMNAEFDAGSETRIIVPTVFRDDYLGALRRLSRFEDPGPLIKAMTYAHDVFAAVEFREFQATFDLLRRINAFEEDTDRRLLLPAR